MTKDTPAMAKPKKRVVTKVAIATKAFKERREADFIALAALVTRGRTVRETDKWLTKQQKDGWPGSKSIHPGGKKKNWVTIT